MQWVGYLLEMYLDVKEIINLYVEKSWTLRMIAEKFNTDHHKIKRRLVENSIKITRRKSLKELSEEVRIKMSNTRKRLYKEGKIVTPLGRKANKIDLYKNMRGHLKYDISLEWLMQFEDIEKLKFLNCSISNGREKIGFDTQIYKNFINKFYNDSNFNRIYLKWISGGCKDNYLRPSLDHIIPKAKGGSLTDLNNLQFITWFENRAKKDLTQEEWDKIKNNIKDYLS